MNPQGEEDANTSRESIGEIEYKGFLFQVGDVDPGLFIEYSDVDQLHYCMQVGQQAGALPAGLMPGINPVESTINLRNWVSAQIIGIGGVPCMVAKPGEGASSAAFHHLTPTQLSRCINILVQPKWCVSSIEANATAGTVYQVFGSGRGSVDISALYLGPFRG